MKEKENGKRKEKEEEGSDGSDGLRERIGMKSNVERG
jgi:hypothetical protein